MTEKKKPPEGHGWKPGQSGNPKGRPKGSGDVAQIRSAIATRIPELLEAMMRRALDGDVGAARLLLERDGGLTGPRGTAARILLYLLERDWGVQLLRGG